MAGWHCDGPARPAKTLRAPTLSACAWWPQLTQWNFSCVGRFSFAVCPHSGHRREVLRRSTAMTSRPALSAKFPCKELTGPRRSVRWFERVVTPALHRDVQVSNEHGCATQLAGSGLVSSGGHLSTSRPRCLPTERCHPVLS